MNDIIYTSDLNKHYRLTIRDVPMNAPERYIWRIHFLDDNGDEQAVVVRASGLYVSLTSSVKNVLNIVPPYPLQPKPTFAQLSARCQQQF